MRLKFYLPVLAMTSATLLPINARPAEAPPKPIGLATHVENRVNGIISGQQQIVNVGSNVYQLEVIRTNENSKAQLAFLDDTVLSVGPMSEVNLDNFVYDPNRGSGDVVVQMGRGTFRFITGSQDKRNYKIVTPVATIGVRGTVFHVKNDGTESILVLQEGGVTLTFPNGMTTDINEPGWGIIVSATGAITGPLLWPGGAGDPFGVGWQQFADAGNSMTTAVGGLPVSPFFSVTFAPAANAVTPCLTPSCN